jgi:glycosyltransferase involved in cell wall biosynthesis
MSEAARPSLAVLVPCRNEEATLGTVVKDYRRTLPDAIVYVYDNESTDRTAKVARDAGRLPGPVEAIRGRVPGC